MKMFLLSLAVVVGMLTGCGKREGESTAYQNNSNRCSQEFINAYNSLVLDTQSFKTRLDLDLVRTPQTAKDEVVKLKNNARDFGARYKGVSCKALVGGKEQFITVDSEIATYISQMEKAEKAIDEVIGKSKP